MDPEREPIDGVQTLAVAREQRDRVGPDMVVQVLDPRTEAERAVAKTPRVHWSCEYVRRQGWERGRVERYLAPLADLAADTTAHQIVHKGLWTAYGNLLDLLGDARAAQIAFARGLEEERPSTELGSGESGDPVR